MLSDFIFEKKTVIQVLFVSQAANYQSPIS